MQDRGHQNLETGIRFPSRRPSPFPGGNFMQQEVTQVRRMCGWLWMSMAALLLAAAAVAAAGPGYHIMATYKLGGDGGWDYLTVDAAARRLYISRATHVMVVDADSGKVVGDCADTPGVLGSAIA